MVLPNVTITAGFNLPVTSATAFVLDDPVAGLLDSVVYGLDDPVTDITSYATSCQIHRGRDSLVWETINAGTCIVNLLNNGRIFDPSYTAGPYYGQLVPGVSIIVTVDTIVVFTGRVQDWNYSYEVGGVSYAVLTAVDALGTFGGQEFDAWTTSAGELTGARISAVLDRGEVSWSGGARSIATGNTTLQADNVSWGSNVLNYLQLVNQSELGYFFADRTGVVTFADRFTGFNVAAATLFDDTNTNITFHGAERAAGSEQLFNRVGVDPAGGTSQTATDTVSAAAYGWKSLSLSGLLMDSDAQASDMANYLVGVYSLPVDRMSKLDVKLHDSVHITAAQRALVLALDITAVIGVTWTPDRVGTALTANSIVQGVDHDIQADTHLMSFHLSDASDLTIFTLDDDNFGLLDSDSRIGF